MPLTKEIKGLIVQSFLGELSKPDNLLLEQWKQENERHQSLYEALRQKWESGELLKNWEDIDLQKNWLAIQEKARPEHVIALGYWLRFAAAAVILIFVAVWYFKTYTPQTLINHGNQFLVHELEDGSRVWLKPGARLEFRYADFDEVRRVDLQGEAFFEVKKATAPFIVEAPDNSKVEVLGTSFHVMTDAAQTEVLLIEGSVKFSFQQLSLQLKPGDFAVFDGQELLKQPFADPNAIGWKTGQFDFKEMPVYQVLEYLAPYYGIETEVTFEKRNLLLTTTIQQLSLDELVTELAFILDAEVTLDGQKLIIR